jgi:hypothetical protein
VVIQSTQTSHPECSIEGSKNDNAIEVKKNNLTARKTKATETLTARKTKAKLSYTRDQVRTREKYNTGRNQRS